MSDPLSAPGEVAVRHNVAASRFETTVGGGLAVADYELQADSVIFTHTLVPPAARGRGVAEGLVRAALGWAKEKPLRVVPACSYVARFIDRHPEFRALTR